MATIDIFSDNAFSLVELTAALRDLEYAPNFLGSLGIFTSRSVRTETFAIEREGDKLTLVPVTERGAPLPQLTKPGRNLRDFRTVRVAKGDRLNASEIANIRAFGTESEFEQVQTEVADRMMRLRRDIDLTHEYMRLGAILGKVLDASGNLIYDWFAEWGFAEPAIINFNFSELTEGKLRKKTTGIKREIRRGAQGAWNTGTRIMALCGDEFYDNLIMAKEIRETYLGWSAAADLRGDGGEWEAFPFGGMTWVNYQGTDDNAKVAIPVDECRFFPVGAPEAFLRINSPGESFEMVNTPGQEFYALTVPDKDRDMWVDIEVYSYPQYVVTRPKMLRRGKFVG